MFFSIQHRPDELRMLSNKVIHSYKSVEFVVLAWNPWPTGMIFIDGGPQNQNKSDSPYLNRYDTFSGSYLARCS